MGEVINASYDDYQQENQMQRKRTQDKNTLPVAHHVGKDQSRERTREIPSWRKTYGVARDAFDTHFWGEGDIDTFPLV